MFIWLRCAAAASQPSPGPGALRVGSLGWATLWGARRNLLRVPVGRVRAKEGKRSPFGKEMPTNS